MNVVEDILGCADAARIGDALEPCGNIHRVAEQIAAVSNHNVADCKTDAKQNFALSRHRGVARIVGVLNGDGAARCVDRAGEFGQDGVARGIEHPSPMRLHQAGEFSRSLAKAANGVFFVRADHAAITGDVRRQNDGQLASHVWTGSGHDGSALSHRPDRCVRYTRCPAAGTEPVGTQP